MTDTPDYQSVLDHIRARREQLDAAIVAMEAMLGEKQAAKPDAAIGVMNLGPSNKVYVSGLSPRPSAALTESAIRAALKNGADTVATIAAHAKLSVERVKPALKAMRQNGTVTMTGRTHTTRYQLA
jgi:hypothetical protein